jgi:EAL domain-containing protein (putative c-di-GMP-specific phosphodiesterase class I)
VSEVLNDNNDAVIVRTIVALAGNLGLSVIAEGVETGGQAEFLAANGCHACQGYLFGRPVPLAELEVALLQAPFRTEENPGSE